jgi:NADPH-dependent 2,4-dienoyl-CoA reductase/sulfur reductase-like enzyme
MNGPQRTIVVVGGLAAGPSAASKAARTDAHARVIMLEQSDAISYGICEIPYFVAGQVAEKDLVVHTAESLKREKGVDVRLLHRVEELHPGTRRLTVRDLATGNVFEQPYDRLILATGATPRRLGIPGEDARNVFHIRTLDGAVHLHRFIGQEHPRNAVIVGAGYIGVEMAEALRLRGMDVTLLDSRELPLHGMAAPGRKGVAETLARHGVVFKGSESPVTIATRPDGTATHVLTPHATYQAELIVCAVGVIPNTALAVQAGLRLGRSGGILTDQWQRTSGSNIFAAGDCCEVRNCITNTPMYVPLATIASRAGWVAGTNAAGGRAKFDGALRSVAVKAFELEAVRIGLDEDEAQASGFTPVSQTITARSRVGVMPGSKSLTVTLVADRVSGRLLGGTLFGEEGAVLRGHALAVALQQRLTVDAFRATDFAYAPPFSPLWDPLLVAANALARELQPTERP